MEKVMIETNRSSKTDEAADYLSIKIVPAAFVMFRIVWWMAESITCQISSREIRRNQRKGVGDMETLSEAD